MEADISILRKTGHFYIALTDADSGRIEDWLFVRGRRYSFARSDSTRATSSGISTLTESCSVSATRMR
jgi:hypothetical protein